MSDNAWKSLSIVLTIVALAISCLAIVDGLTPKPTDGLIWRLGQEKVIVEGVIPGGPGDIAGIREGDIILGIDHNLVRKPAEAATILMGLQIGLRTPYLVLRGSEILTINITPYPYRTGDSRLLYRALVGLVFISVGLYTVLNRTNLPAARLFFLMSACFLLVLTCSFRGSPYYWIDLIVQNVASWGLTILGPLFLHFFLIFPARKRFLESYSALLLVFYLIPFIQHLLFTLSQYFVISPFTFLPASSHRLEILGVHLELWALMGIYLVAGVFVLVHSYMNTSDPLRRRQVKMLVWGTFIGLTPFLSFSVVGAGIFGEAELFSIGVLPLMAIPLSFAYSIIRYRLLEIQIIVKRSLLYSILTGLFIGVYMIIVNVVGGWVEKVSPFGGTVFGILFVLLIAISFEPTRSRVQKFINRLFYRSDYERQATLSKLTEALRSFSNMEDLAEATLESINNIFAPTGLSLAIIFDTANAIEVSEFQYIDGSIQHKSHILSEDDPLDALSFQGNRTSNKYGAEAQVYIGGTSSDKQSRPPERLELPIFSHQRIVGLLSVHAKKSGDPYTLTELEALEKFSNQAGLAIENLQLIRSIFDANQRLFETEKLVSLGQLASGVAHEIRNPLSSIKMNIQGMARSMKPDTINSRRIEIIQREIDHLDHIVHDVLIYARPSRLNIEMIDIRELVMQTVELLSPQLKDKHHKISINLPEDLPRVAGDRDKLHQVIKNVIVNAEEAIEVDGLIDVTGRLASPYLELSFRDNGPGISEEMIGSIFNPFFTTKADGTGLGLANARKFMQEMKGNLSVVTGSGEGAEFVITLPLSVDEITE